LIVVERPPNFDQILAAFPDADKPGVIFAFGEHIYNPTGGDIPPALLAHEAVHGQRQLDHAGRTRSAQNVYKWWEHYIRDSEFRYTEELHAHVAEYGAQLHRTPDRNSRAKLLMATAHRLVAPLYNYDPPRSLRDAQLDLIREIAR
jgi:hypothetical protein